MVLFESSGVKQKTYIELAGNVKSITAGQILQGTVHLILPEIFGPEHAFFLGLKGHENVYFQTTTHSSSSTGTGASRRTTSSKTVHHHANIAPIIQLEYELARGQELQPGHHSFPFTIPVPSWLPSSFKFQEEQDSKRISVKYMIYTCYKKQANDTGKTHPTSLCLSVL